MFKFEHCQFATGILTGLFLLRFFINLFCEKTYILKLNPLEHVLGLVSNSIHIALAWNRSWIRKANADSFDKINL